MFCSTRPITNSAAERVSLLASNPNLVITRTFSKALSMAGMRFGYMLAHPEIAREVHKAKLPYNVNIFTLTAHSSPWKGAT